MVVMHEHTSLDILLRFSLLTPANELLKVPDWVFKLIVVQVIILYNLNVHIYFVLCFHDISTHSNLALKPPSDDPKSISGQTTQMR